MKFNIVYLGKDFRSQSSSLISFLLDWPFWGLQRYLDLVVYMNDLLDCFKNYNVNNLILIVLWTQTKIHRYEQRYVWAPNLPYETHVHRTFRTYLCFDLFIFVWICNIALLQHTRNYGNYDWYKCHQPKTIPIKRSSWLAKRVNP